jgi:hypothetical protein
MKGLEVHTERKRGLTSYRMLPDVEGVVELTWHAPAGYKSLFSWCKSNMPAGVEWTLECLDDGTEKAFNIHDPGVPEFED